MTFSQERLTLSCMQDSRPQVRKSLSDDGTIQQKEIFYSRQTQLLESHVSGHIVKKEVTEEGEVSKYVEFWIWPDLSQTSVRTQKPSVFKRKTKP